MYNFFLFNKEKFKTTYLQGGQGNLSADIVKSIKIKLPVIEEQQKIANFLSAIDKKIDTVSQQITETDTFKKGLLQKMFV
jgi:type I restriction enzyme S subunit